MVQALRQVKGPKVENSSEINNDKHPGFGTVVASPQYMWCAHGITIYEVCYLPRPLNRVRKLLCNLRTFKIQLHSLNKLRRVFFKYFGEKFFCRVLINFVLTYDNVLRWYGGVSELVAQGEPRPKIMWCHSSLKPTGMKRTTRHPLYTVIPFN